MKAIRLITMLLVCLLFTPPTYAQFDLFTDDEEDVKELENVSYDDFLNGMTQVMSEGEAGPLGNWMSGSLTLMADPRFANAPKEYNCAFIVKTKLLKIGAYEAVLEQVDLSCERTRKTIESYIMFMGTLYLDMFSMEFFLEKETFSYNEAYNIDLGYRDAIEQFENGKILRNAIETLNNQCYNDVNDITVTDCDCAVEGIAFVGYEDFQHKNDYFDMQKLHPVNVINRTKDLQSLLNSLPCK